MEHYKNCSTTAIKQQQELSPLTATEILQRRQRFLAKRWKRHEYALYDIFTIAFSFVDVRKYFMSLALVNKWFYHQVHDCLSNVEEVLCIDEKELIPTDNKLAKYLDKLFRVKIEKNYLRFDDMEGDEEEYDNSSSHENENNDGGESNQYVVSGFRSVFGKVKDYFVQHPPKVPTKTFLSTKETTLLKRAIISIKQSGEGWFTINKYKIEKVYFIHTYSIYTNYLPSIISNNVNYGNLIFFRCANLEQMYYNHLESNITHYERVTYINSSYSSFPSINTSTMDLDSVVEMMQEYDLFSLSPSIVQFKSQEIMEYVKFEKSGSVASGNLLWQSLKKHEKLYPYFQYVFSDLGLYYLKSMHADMSSITEKNFRTFLEKWNYKGKVKKIRLEFLITNTIYCDSTIELFISEANKIDKSLEKKKSLALEKSKLESLATWISDTYKNRSNKKRIVLLLK